VFTIAFWVYARDGQATLFELGKEQRIAFFVSIGQRNGTWAELEARFTAGSAAVSRTHNDYRGLRLDHWRHVAVVFDSSDDAALRIFIDGREPPAYAMQQAGAAASTLSSPAPMYVGNSASGDSPYNGVLDTLLFYERPLSTREIEWLANGLSHNAGSDLRVHFWEKRGVLDPARVQNGVLCFQFDDGYATVAATAKPVFDAFGAVANAAIVSDLVDKGGRLSAPQLRELSHAGWEIVSHSKTHADPYRLTEQELRTELVESKAALESLGLTVNHYAWPYSAPQGAYRVICSEYYRSAADGGSVGTEDNLYALGHVTIDTPGEAAVKGYKTYIDQAMTGNRMLILLMHDPDEDDIPTLSQLLEYAQAKGIPVLTRFDAFDLFLCKPPEPLDRGFSLRCENRSDQPQSLYRTATLPEGDYLISFLSGQRRGAGRLALCGNSWGECDLRASLSSHGGWKLAMLG
jgi:peptidoglycan/xylan/chitin deacetylase (PgdA/CDA1 family)